MELMGLNVQTRMPAGVDAKSNSKASASNNSSALFQNKLDQVAKKSEKNNFDEPSSPQASFKRTAPQLPNSKNLPPPVKQGEPATTANLAPEKTIEDNLVKPNQIQTGPVDSLTRRSAIQVFMKKMEQEVGVDSTELVQAMSQLSAAELAAPPETNIDKIIGFLNLSPAQTEKATFLFNEMLAQSHAESMAEYLQATDRQISLAVMSRNQNRQDNVNRSIEQMNQQFFANPTAPASQQTQMMAQPQSEEESQMFGMMPSSAKVSKSQAVVPAAATVSGMAATLSAQPASTSQTASNTVAAQNSPMASFFPQGMEVASAQMEGTPAVLPSMDAMPLTMPTEWAGISKASMGRSAYGVSASKTSSSLETMGELSGSTDLMALDIAGAEAAALTPEFDNNSGQSDMKQQVFSEIAEKTESGEFFDVETAQMTVKADPSMASNTQDKGVTKADSFMVSHQPTEGEQAANVKEIISQAQFLVKNGGGEMKISLNPEGMGQLNMKVAVQDGQVSIEMITESDDVKKLLEKGLGDLKATLASHKLNVDNVKVDFSGEIAKAFDHAHDEAQRQSAQNFMEQFRQENGAWRRNMFDFQPGEVGRYPGSGGPQDELLRVQAGKPKTQQRRLDLVA